MNTLLKILAITLLLGCIVIIMLKYNVLKNAALKELFNQRCPQNRFGGAGDVNSILPGDMNSVGGMSGLDDLDGTGSGPMGSGFKTHIVQNPNEIPGIVPVTEPGGDEDYPKQAHGMHTYNVASPRSDHGEIIQPYTYYYLEGDNINKVCKSDADCGTTKCSESGFCRY